MSNAFASSVGAGGGEQSASAIVGQDVGSHVLRIDGYSYTKRLGNGKSITSASFTVGGHRWCLKYYPNGMNERYSDWISVYLCLDNTEVDEVKAKVTISLLDREGNPVPSYIHHCKLTRTYSVQADNSGNWGLW
jgi:speckle-type POZ protein